MNNRLSLLVASVAVMASSNARADYPGLVLSDNPKAYYRLNDSTARTLINLNSGSLGAAGNATNDLAFVTGGIVHSMPGAIVGDGNRAAYYDYTTRTEVPFNSAFNTPNTQPFTVEAWIYPVSDQVGTGMGVLANRWTQGGNREGWVMYQRAPDANHCTTCGPGIGWEFRMYNNLDGNGHLDVTSGVPFSLGKWQHVVIVYEPIGGDPTNSTLTIYIDGVPASTNINTTPIPGYAPCTGAHSPAPNGQPAMALGGYNNANSGTYGFANPWIGGIDEFAWYPAKLSAAEILKHYQNGTNANRTQSYTSLIQSDSPAVYLRLNEIAPGPDIAANIGDLRSSGLGTNRAGVRHPSGGAIAGDSGAGSTSYHYRNGGGTTTQIPWTSQNNPDASFPFSFECWVRPTGDQMNPGPAVVNNRFVNPNPGSNASGSPVKNRTGWVIYQRCPDITYTTSGPVGESGFGYALRVYAGTSGNSSDVQTITPYVMGQWSHLVFTWEPQLNVSPAGNNGVAWNGILTAFVNGVPVNTNSSATYCANTSPSDDGSAPSDFGIGSYNAASGFTEEFEGDIAEVAFYNNYVLTSDQILAHYEAGTNSNYGTNYATLVMNAASEALAPPITERLYLPATYMRLNDTAYFPAANSGSAGAADGDLVLTTNITAGPQSPTYPGFEASNTGVPLDGVKQWASLNNAAGLNISGQITLEAWVKPGASQGATSRILTHGPTVLSKFDAATLGLTLSGSLLSSNEVFLRIDGSGANYIVGSSDGANTNAATYPVPAGDLGSANWIHLVGTYDGASWKLYRNGALVATQASGTGALPQSYAGWAIGSSGSGWSDPFSGQVDEVAIYDHALTANQVLGHYNAGTLTPKMNITKSGSNVIVTWPYGTLYHATNVTGPWTPVPGNPAFSFTTNTVAPRRFFRF